MVSTQDLSQQIAEQQTKIRTTEYPIPIGQIINMYKEGAIQLEPKFQRFFRWTIDQKTRLIESLLLGIPVPPIFMSQNPDGTYEVVDGVQRLSTVLEFVGELNGEDGKQRAPFSCVKAFYVPLIEGFAWNSKGGAKKILPDDIKNIFRYEVKLDFKLILRQSDQRAKYELFDRLNSGGTPASNQEIRNCTLIKLNEPAYDMLERCAAYYSFRETCQISEKSKEERFDLELVLRFILLKNIEVTARQIGGDLNKFLHDQMVEFFEPGADLDREEEIFYKTFDLIYTAAGEDAFRMYREDKKRFTGAFSLSCFETTGLGIGYHFSTRANYSPDPKKLLLKIKKLSNLSDFRAAGGSGVSSAGRLPKTTMLGRSYYK